jgi:hypothetical protein
VRQAVRFEYARRIESVGSADPVRTLREIYEAHPSQSIPARGFDVHDRHAFASALRRHLTKR